MQKSNIVWMMKSKGWLWLMSCALLHLISLAKKWPLVKDPPGCEANIQPGLTIRLNSWMQMHGLKKHLFSPAKIYRELDLPVFARCFQNRDKNTSARKRRRGGSEMTKIKSNCNKWKDECWEGGGGWEHITALQHSAVKAVNISLLACIIH